MDGEALELADEGTIPVLPVEAVGAARPIRGLMGFPNLGQAGEEWVDGPLGFSTFGYRLDR